MKSYLFLPADPDAAAETQAKHELMDLVRNNAELNRLVLELRDTGRSWRDVKTAIKGKFKAARRSAASAGAAGAGHCETRQAEADPRAHEQAEGESRPLRAVPITEELDAIIRPPCCPARDAPLAFQLHPSLGETADRPCVPAHRLERRRSISLPRAPGAGFFHWPRRAALLLGRRKPRSSATRQT